MVRKVESSSTSSKIEAQLIITRDLLEDARSLGIDVSKFEKRLEMLELKRPENLVASVAPLMIDLSEAIEEFKRAEEEAASVAAEVELTPLEVEVYEYVMKHGGMSVSDFSERSGITEEATRRAIERIVELDMLEVRGV